VWEILLYVIFPSGFFFFFNLSFLAGCSTFGLQELVTNDFCGWLHSCECAFRGPTQNELGVLYWFSSSEFLSLTIFLLNFFLFFPFCSVFCKLGFRSEEIEG
jgi:hypothetical protein